MTFDWVLDQEIKLYKGQLREHRYGSHIRQWYCINVKILSNNCIVVMYALFLRRYMVKYLGVNSHEIYNSLSTLSTKYTHRRWGDTTHSWLSTKYVWG